MESLDEFRENKTHDTRQGNSTHQHNEEARNKNVRPARRSKQERISGTSVWANA